MKRVFTLLFFCCCFNWSFAQDSLHIKVHFLYGSKPQKKHKDTESKWFGGRKGGHVGIELDSTRILNFIPQGKFHLFASKVNLHSTYAEHSKRSFITF